MFVVWALAYCLMFQNSVTQAQSYYTVIAPQVIRPNSDYHVAITTTGLSEPVTIHADIDGQKFSGGTVYLTESINIQPYTTRTLLFKVGNLGEGRYNLTVRSEGSFPFRNTTFLRYSPKSHSVFIQTDKGVYKPGDKVQFRVLFLTPYLKPISNREVNLYVTDGAGNRVKQWSNVTTNRGLFSSEIELSSYPVLGDWKLFVNIDGEQNSKQFEVAEYVLPKFEVTIDLPDFITFKDSKFGAVIRAKYTYGKPVKGEATIAVYTDVFSGIIQPIFKPPVRKTVPIDGKALVEFDIVKELSLPDDFEREIKFDVTVKEELTGRKQNVTSKLLITKHKYKLEMINTANIFKPGLRHQVFIRLIHHDGTPVIDSVNPITIRTSYSYNEEDFNSTEYKVPSNGVLELNYYPTLKTQVISIEGTYLDVKEYFSAMSSALSNNGTFLRAYLLTENPKINEDVEIEVNCTVPMSHLSYEIIGRGDVVIANSVSVAGKTVARWRFLATYLMAPRAYVVVQFVHNGEIVADVLDIEFGNPLQNFVDVNVTPKRTEPGKNIDLSISSKPNSVVGLLAVDQSVLLLKGGNDLTQEIVEDEVRLYDPTNPARPLPSDNHPMIRPFALLGRKKRFAPFRVGGYTTQEVFDNAGVIVMTNAQVYSNTPWRYFRGMYPEDNLMLPAMSLADRSIGYGGGFGIPQQIIRVRSKFPETWIWDELETGITGRTSITKSVPDTITSWVITAFSLDSVYGLGVIEAPSKLTVFRPFFVSLNLPYSVIRGETLSIPIVVFNYMDKDITAEVTIENSGQFEFSDLSNEVNEHPKLELFRRKHITVGRNSGASTSFMITPKQLGYIDIKVIAKSPLAGDAITKTLLVKPEGETQYKNKAVFIDLREGTNNFKTNFTLDIPANIVPDSEHIEIAAVGDILGPSISNLDKLIRMPFGCGEQNMLNFVPNILVLKYLTNTNQLTKAVETKCIRYMEKGYQRELTYKHPDGSFSAFGKADKSGSVWLTAFVAKSFIQAKPYILIDEEVILGALRWLSEQQAANGSFPEVGVVSHKEMQGGAANGIALTAYVLTAFLEGSYLTEKYKNTINKAVSYLNTNMREVEDPYALAVMTYGITFVRHPSSETALHLMDRNAQTKDSMKWWQRKDIDKMNPNTAVPNSIDVEMTSYAMLSYMERGLISECIPILKWLITQQNNEGGFASTQDTVLALTALSELAAKISSKNIDITTSFSYKAGLSNDIRVNQGNSMILQTIEIPKKIREINITATGRGFVVAQISYRYNVNVTGAWPMFTLDPQVDKNSDNNHLQLSICSGFTGGNESNMAVMEVSLPSGYTVDVDSLPSLEISQNVKRVETKEGDTVVVLYFDKMTSKEYCPTVSAFRTHRVARQRPVPVTIYDYYDQSRKARVFYEPIVSTPCDICEGEDCGACSGSKAGTRSDEINSACLSTPNLSLLIFTLFSVYFAFCESFL